MQGTVDGFTYGAVTPVVAFLMACLGSALGLRCTTRSLRTDRSWKPAWLALGAACIGSGIWTMHFIAMIGFSVSATPIRYDLTATVESLLVAIAVVAVGVFIVGHWGARPVALVAAGLVTGIGVAAMHYLGMSGLRFQGHVHYNGVVVVLSVVVAVVAATAALWAAVSIHGFLPSLGASVVMGIAVTGMHYTGMAGVRVRLSAGSYVSAEDAVAASSMFPVFLGPLLFLVIAAVVVMFDPLLILGGDWDRPAVAHGRGKNPPHAY
ncbi:hypothetical protein OG735_01275 [Streptomyces sp. NBC_01210]|uniref:MHYT domain-containing protein n=1 Tax=Streptomyces sp. NBC_01210 TaxID=2903774 RepID=UPI002E1561DB|nr:hypothetical protein OG735_01275 [Streptomyces sp. NBC_01210]